MRFCILKDKIRDLLSEKLANNIFEATKADLIKVLRYNSLGGFEFLDDEDLLENLIVHISEFDMLKIDDSDKEKFVFSIKEEFIAKEAEILKKINTELKVILFT